jgi:WD40 repeat protein
MLAGISPGGDAAIHLWDVATGKPIQPERTEGAVFSPDGRIVAIPTWGGSDSTIRLWAADTGELLQQLRGHEAAIDKVVFMPDGKRLISAGIDGTVRLWDLATGTEIWKDANLGSQHYNVPGMALSPDGKRLTSIHSLVEEEQLVVIWEVQTGKRLLQRRESQRGSFLSFVPFSADRDFVAAPGDGALHLREIATGRHLLSLELPEWQTWMSELVAFSPDGRSVAAVTGSAVTNSTTLGGSKARSAECTIHLWELATGKEFRRIG